MCRAGHGNGIGAGSVHHGDAFAGGGIEVDVVDAHAGAPDHPQLSSVFQKRFVNLDRRTNDQRVRRLQLVRKLALDLFRSNYGPSRLAQQIHRR